MMKHLLFLLAAIIMTASVGLVADQPDAKESTVKKALTGQELVAKLKSITIPRVSFKGEKLSQALPKLAALITQYDPDGLDYNIVLLSPGGGDPQVNITLRSLSADRILDFVCESVGHSWDISDGSVVVSRAGASLFVEITAGTPSTNADPFAAPSSPSQQLRSSRISFMGTAGGMAAPKFNTEGYDFIDENKFRSPQHAPLSTFSIDVDTASYSNVRRIINQGRDLPLDAVRIEELINYFPYDYEPPATEAGADPEETDITKLAEHPFTVHAEVGPAPWAEEHQLVKIGLKGYEVEWDKRPPANLVFLLDVSGSMQSPQKLPLVVDSMKKLVAKLDGRDRVAIVVYAGASGLVLPSTTANNQETIMHAMEQLSAGGSTNGGQGIELAYAQAQEHFIDDGINRVILCTDGDFNVGVTDRGQLTRLIEDKAKSGVFLTVLGFGSGNLKDDMMETLSNKGNGNYAYIDSEKEARKVFSREAGGSMITIAKDVKIQVEFNPALVQAYRLVGYENRKLKDEDFNDDKVDAGELGSGHTVTAIYEIVPPGVEIDLPKVDELKYQTNTAPAGSADELMTVKLRYKWPKDDESNLLSVVVPPREVAFADTSDDFRFATAVAGWGMLLRDSEYKGDVTLDWVETTATNALGNDPGGYRDGFLELVEKSQPAVEKLAAKGG